MCKEWQPKVIAIKESNDLSSLNITKLFGKLAEHESGLKWLTDREVKSKKKEKGKEEKIDLLLNASSSKAKNSKEESDNSDEKALREEDIC